MIHISINQEVKTSMGYVTCETGEFGELELVLCKRREDELDSTCAFLAISIVGGDLTNGE